ncbi:hypothetical protein BOTBODRAFT_173515 [Botryobasidium botryosum FD-172 SS1]|uniref:F-box domain-containing protein n=1 Tax=Botryobasidium botryosum (strain FD-172 SS1) TaxID=930990 RepID=A0A067MVI0_BOTB1|nr:hypothetical protein BOTBODRAFT_173515 [Botryobasidium botryosum FD-172 SS1]
MEQNTRVHEGQRSSNTPPANEVKQPSEDRVLSSCQVETSSATSRDLAVVATAPSYTIQALSVQNTHYNRLSSVHRLPNEILSMIFQLAKDNRACRSHPLETRAPLNVSRVSRLWQRLAISTPALWASIDDTNAHMAPLFLERSGNAGLEIELVRGHYSFGNCTKSPAKTYNRYIDCFSESFNSLVPHTSKWKSLRVELEVSDLDELELFLALPAPRLEKLRLCVGNDYLEGVETEDESQELFGGCTPSLRHLALAGVAISLTSPIYFGLVTLELSDVIFELSPLWQLVENLAACPLLEELNLGGYDLPLIPRMDPSFTQPLSDIHYLLLSLRSTSSLWMRDDYEESIFDSFPQGEDVAKFLPNLCLTTKLLVRIHHEGCTLCGITPGPPAITHQFRLEGRQPCHYPNITERAFIAIGRDSIYPHLQTLWVEGICEGRLYAAPFVEALGALPTITSLSLRKASSDLIEPLIFTPKAQLCPLL